MNSNQQLIALLILLQGAIGAFAGRGSSSSSYDGGTGDDCVDTYENCASYVSAGYCATYFCETCAYSNYCYASCGYCDDGSPAPAPTPQPTHSPTTDAFKNECKDTYSNCASYVTSGDCPTYFCDTCAYSNYCDASCGYCDDDASESR